MLNPMTRWVVPDRLKPGVELALAIEAAPPMKRASLAVNIDLKVMRACDRWNAHSGCKTPAEKTRETWTQCDLDGATEHATFSVKALKQWMKLGEATAKPLFNDVSHLAFSCLKS